MRSSTIGYLGSGQLSLMLAQAGQKLGLKAIALGPEANDPVSLAGEVIVGRLDDRAALEGLFARASRIVFENEFVDCDLLELAGKRVTFIPALSVIGELQDKISQKRLLERLGIRAAAWFPRGAGEAPAAFVARAGKRFPSGYVLKWARMGYDGKGVLISGHARATGEAERAGDAEAFVAEAERAGIPVFAEEKIAFRRELAMVSVYSTQGELAHYPLVVSIQSGGICRTIQGPASVVGVTPQREREARVWDQREPEAREVSARLARGINLHGAFAIEFFEGAKGELLVNEIAPRVHNTGHYTQDCASTSQFENHLRAILGEKLGPASCDPAFAMVNLIGPKGVSLQASGKALPEEKGAGVLHWYGKREIRPGRKMGHLNGSVDDPVELPILLNALEQRRIRWESQLK